MTATIERPTRKIGLELQALIAAAAARQEARIVRRRQVREDIRKRGSDQERRALALAEAGYGVAVVATHVPGDVATLLVTGDL